MVKPKRVNWNAQKVCSRCRQTLSAMSFGRQTATKDGLQPTCIRCRAAMQQANRQRRYDGGVRPTDEDAMKNFCFSDKPTSKLRSLRWGIGKGWM